jgi:hypothetical protein
MKAQLAIASASLRSVRAALSPETRGNGANFFRDCLSCTHAILFAMAGAKFFGQSLGAVCQTASAVCQIGLTATILNQKLLRLVAPREMILKLVIISRETAKLAHTWHLTCSCRLR